MSATTDFETKFLGDVCDIFAGYAWQSKKFNTNRDGLPIIRIQNVGSDGTEDLAYWSHEYDERFIIREGDLLLSLSGSFRIARWKGTDALLNQRVVKLTPTRQLCDRWLYHVITRYLGHIERMGKHALVNNVSLTDLRAFEIPLPPLSEQKRIADILDKADAIRRKRQETLRTFTQLVMASFRQLFGTFPEATWKTKPFGELVESTQLGIVRGSKEMNDEYPFPYLRMDALIGDGDIKFEPIKRVRATPEEAEQFRLRAGDFLFNTRNSRELVGKTAVLHEEHQPPLLFNNNIMRVRFGSEIDPVYMNYLLQLPQMQYLLEQRKSGTTSVFAVYYKNLKDLPIPVAPIALQRTFASFVTSMLKWRGHCRDAAKESQAFFDSLVQRAFRGEL